MAAPGYDPFPHNNTLFGPNAWAPHVTRPILVGVAALCAPPDAFRGDQDLGYMTTFLH